MDWTALQGVVADAITNLIYRLDGPTYATLSRLCEILLKVSSEFQVKCLAPQSILMLLSLGSSQIGGECDYFGQLVYMSMDTYRRTFAENHTTA